MTKRAARNRLASFQPYSKQREFHEAGATKRERLLMAANRFGKTECGAAELAMHLTGRYPNWWRGKRFNKPVRAWAAGVTNESTRDVVQAKLVGPPARNEEWGTGLIPHAALGSHSPSRGVAGLIDTISIRHEAGGWSTLQFKSYERGREKWQGAALEVIWLDEEPDKDIYSEALTRTNETGGIVYLTFTPLLGMSEVVRRFVMEPNPDRHVTTATIDDAEHFSEEERARIIASYAEWERDARTKGIPALGSGRIFPISESDITVAPFEIPSHWPQIAGLDFGWDHPTAAAKLAWDRDNDVIYVTADYRRSQQTPIMHCGALKPWGKGLVWAWPHDGLQHDKGSSGEQLAKQYRDHGLALTTERATFLDGTNGVEAGVSEMLERMQTNRWKVFSTCGAWFEELRLYHRDDGQIVKEFDDVLCASRYAMMMRRHAKTLERRTIPKPNTAWVR